MQGRDVVNRIEPGDKIVHVTIRRVGPAAAAFMADAARFEHMKSEVLENRRRIASTFVYLEDGTKQLPDFRVKNFNFKLANYERITGTRIAIRMLPELPASPAGQSVGTAAKMIAATLGLPDSGNNVLLCYFAAMDVWTSRLGEATDAALIGESGTTEKLMANGVLHDKKVTLIASAQAQTKVGKVKEGVDAAIDAVILKLDDFSLQQAGRK